MGNSLVADHDPSDLGHELSKDRLVMSTPTYAPPTQGHEKCRTVTSAGGGHLFAGDIREVPPREEIREEYRERSGETKPRDVSRAPRAPRAVPWAEPPAVGSLVGPGEQSPGRWFPHDREPDAAQCGTWKLSALQMPALSAKRPS